MMSCPGFMIGLSLSLLVLLGGLFLLAYAKKEGLGKFHKLASYVAIIFGTVAFVGGLACATMCGSCKGSKCEKREVYRMEMRHGGCEGETCAPGAMKCHKDMDREACMKACKEGKCDKGSCEKGAMKCEKNMEYTSKCDKEKKDCCKAEVSKEVVIEKK